MRYLSHVDEYLTLKYKYKYKYSGHKYKYKYKYKYFKMVLEYYSSTSTSTKYYISATKRLVTADRRARRLGRSKTEVIRIPCHENFSRAISQ